MSDTKHNVCEREERFKNWVITTIAPKQLGDNKVGKLPNGSPDDLARLCSKKLWNKGSKSFTIGALFRFIILNGKWPKPRQYRLSPWRVKVITYGILCWQRGRALLQQVVACVQMAGHSFNHQSSIDRQNYNDFVQSLIPRVTSICTLLDKYDKPLFEQFREEYQAFFSACEFLGLIKKDRLVRRQPQSFCQHSSKLKAA